MGKVLGILASNLRAGGGVTHLREVLKVAKPQEYGFDKVVVWSCQSTLDVLPDVDWLEKVHHPALEQNVRARLKWQRTIFEKEVKDTCDVLWTPGGGYTGDFQPFISMSRNMLVFEAKERNRYRYKLDYFRFLMLFSVQSKSFKKAAGMIFISNYAKEYISKKINLKNKNTRVINHGMSNVFRETVKEQKPIEDYSFENPYNVLYVSPVYVYKHQWNVVKAVAELRKKGYPLALTLVGKSVPDAKVTLDKAIAEHDPQGEWVTCHGHVDYEEIDKIYKASDLFVFASSCENMPNTLIEAMSSGLPIACSKLGPMPEFLQEAGVYFDPEQPETIEKSIKEFVDNQKIRKEKAEISLANSKTYSWEKCANESFKFVKETYDKYTA